MKMRVRVTPCRCTQQSSPLSASFPLKSLGSAAAAPAEPDWWHSQPAPPTGGELFLSCLFPGEVAVFLRATSHKDSE